MKLLYIGYITGPFGLKGEVKILSETNHKNDIFNVIKALSENVSALERHHLEYRIKRKDGSYL